MERSPVARRTAGLAHQLRRALDEGLTVAVLADAEGITVGELERFLRSHGQGDGAERRPVPTAAPRAAPMRRPNKQPSSGSEIEVVAQSRSGLADVAIARSLGLPVARVRTVMMENASDYRLRRRAELAPPRRPVRATLECCLAAVREAAALLGRTPTIAEYIELARERPGWPAGSTISIYWGWRLTLERAGLVEPRRRKRRVDALPAVACWDALHQVADELGRVPSSIDYDRTSVGRADLPSLKTVQRRLGGWRTIVRLWPGPRDADSLPAVGVRDRLSVGAYA